MHRLRFVLKLPPWLSGSEALGVNDYAQLLDMKLDDLLAIFATASRAGQKSAFRGVHRTSNGQWFATLQFCCKRVNAPVCGSTPAAEVAAARAYDRLHVELRGR